MVYDPIRDCDMPSPAASMHNPSPWADTPNSELPSPGPGLGQYPPHFQHDRRSPAAGPTFRSTSGGLRGLLNEEGGGSAMDTRASSGRDSFSSTPGADEPAPPPPRSRSIHQLLQEGAPTISQSSSQSSLAYSSHSHHSPVGKPYSLLDHDGFLAPTTPASGYPRPSRSPHSFNSPSGYPHASLPPMDLVHGRSPYPQMAMSDQGMPLRSPSISMSPRQHYQSLPPPHPSSRPGSSSSAGGFAFSTPGIPVESPYARQMSVDHIGRPRSGSRATGPQSRRSSASLAPPPQRARSPSPPPKIPYAPNRISAPSPSLSRPIGPEELEELMRVARINNPLRSAAANKPPPQSWSAPSPSPGMRRTSQPYESDSSYFPSHNGREASEGAGPSASKKRKTSGNYARGPKGNGNGPEEQRRKVEEKKYTGNVALVADHYNARQEVGKDAREFSPIIGLRKFNNWVKSVLIGKFAHRPPGGPGANVLDIGCGKGGDLQKWAKARINRMVALDIASTSIEQARERHATLRGPTFRADFIAHDCYAQSIKDVIPRETAQPGYFDNVTMQFCMHYAFESASKVRMMLENVTRYMRIGGMFVGTIPDSDLLLKRLNELPEGETTFGNSCYSVRFAERNHKGLYGHAYHFYLQDAVDDVPEYIVNWDNFMGLAFEYGLTLKYKKAFNEILSEEQGSRDFGPLLGRMGVINDQGVSTMDEDQWEAANLYMGFALEKYR